MSLSVIVYYYAVFFFFFQAEDGIRDLTVTGVQTCALPISLRAWLMRHGELPLRRTVEILRGVLGALAHAHAASAAHGDLKPENVLLADEEIGRASCRERV